MNSIIEFINTPSFIQTVILITFVSALGIALGKIKICGISLGITFVFFVGILVGHLGVEWNRDMMLFAQNFGLILFIYNLGLQVGPGFFSSFKKGGIKLNILAVSVIMIGVGLTISLPYITGVSLTNMVGLLCGSVTNTPALGAAQQAAIELKNGDRLVADMSLACAAAYPLGVVGVIIAIVGFKKFTYKNNTITVTDKVDNNSAFVTEFLVKNPQIYNKTIAEIMKLTSKNFVISRVWKDEKVTSPGSNTILHKNDHLLIISAKCDVDSIKDLFGEQINTELNDKDVDWKNTDNNQLVSRQILVTNSKINGIKLGTLRLRNNYGINITRINRAGIELIPSPNLRLQFGDKLNVVGEAGAINQASSILGNEVKRLTHPNLIAIFTGILLGVGIGALPIYIPFINTTVKLGIAGGPIIVGILMGAFGPRFHFTTYTTQSANLMMRQLGIIIYLAGLGISSGANFFETVIRLEGLLWVAIGFGLTMIPIIIVGIISSKILKLDYSQNIGVLCGSMSNPIALTYANTTVENDEPSVAYATVYPLSMFLRVISAQIIVTLLA